MSTSLSSARSLPDPSDFCPGCGRFSCRCAETDAAHDARLEASYRAGYEACRADGYDERPGLESVYRTGHRVFYRDGRVVHAMAPLRFAAFTWRRHHRTEAAYRRWFERTYRLDLGAYLRGYDDAGAGAPSAVDDPEDHRLCAEALDGYGPVPDPAEAALGPWPPCDGVDDGLPFWTTP